MALINNPNSWNGGTAVFNSAPITETYLKLAAHREAKNRALDQYHQKQAETLDRDGVRDVDAPEFSKKLDQWNQHWQLNKKGLQKGDVKAQIDNDKLYNDLRGFVRQSRARAELDKSSIPVAVSMKNEMGTYPDQFQQDLMANNLPIGAEGSKPLDLNPYMMRPERWDMEKGLKRYGHLERQKRTNIGQVDPQTGMRMDRTEEFFDDKAKAQVAAIAGSDFHNDRSFNKAVRDTVADPQAKIELEKVFIDNFGKKPEQPEEYATAFIMSQKPLTKFEEKPVADEQWKKQKENEEWERRNKIQQAGRFALAAFNAKNRKELQDARLAAKKMGDEEQQNALDASFESIKQGAIKNGARQLWDEKGNKEKKYYEAQLPNIIKKDFAYKSGTEWVYPDKILFNEGTGDVDIVFYKRNEDGEIVKKEGKNVLDGDKSHKTDENQLKAILGKKLFGVKTTSEATYYGDEDDEDDDMGGGVMPAAPAKSNKKKIPGF